MTQAAKAGDALPVTVRPRAFACFSTTGALLYASEGGAAWIAQGRLAEMIRLAIPRFLHEGLSAITLQSDHTTLELIALSGEPQGAVLLCLQAAPPTASWILQRLTPAQREVALYASKGASLPEIARLVGRAQGTVHTHLREVYRRLGVSNRVELAEVLRDPSPERASEPWLTPEAPARERG